MTVKDTLGELEQLAMLSVLRLGDEAYAASVRRDLVESAGRSVAAATVHVTLVRLERKGYVESAVSEPEPVRGGRSRRCFRVTPAGAVALRESRSTLERMWSRVKRHPDLRAP